MNKRALIVGIDRYDTYPPLSAAVSDAEAMADILSKNGDGSPNFGCRLLTSPGREAVTRANLRRNWRELFDGFRGDVLFYFSGHGAPTEVGGFLATQDAAEDDPGLAMEELVNMANNSAVKTVLLILDCCFSGSAGNPAALRNGNIENKAILREGVTILSASRPAELSYEVGGHGVFSNLILGALKGGAANVRGHISAAAIYAYVEAALGPWDQRPLYKSHAEHLEPVRTVPPMVSDELLREMTTFFPAQDHRYSLNETYEETSDKAKPENVIIFKKFKRLQIAGLLRPDNGSDLYWVAIEGRSVVLTDLGIFYYQLIRKHLI
ncbi:caspase domain-containing protein [Rhizobium leguminosarum]|uniref:caspase family protein n=1 Tax=Rhizobium leguminosarum TaxID=384 RepID=UPI001C97D8C8|nr:caspase family protein [Rhizobium leguminosarum]MBY5370466.1 caspase family protein [Rhizobium leguminosarum]